MRNQAWEKKSTCHTTFQSIESIFAQYILRVYAGLSRAAMETRHYQSAVELSLPTENGVLKQIISHDFFLSEHVGKLGQGICMK